MFITSYDANQWFLKSQTEMWNQLSLVQTCIDKTERGENIESKT